MAKPMYISVKTMANQIIASDLLMNFLLQF